MVMIDVAGSDEFSSLARQMNSLVENAMGRQYFGFSPTDAWRPAVNLYETEGAFIICVDLGGMDEKEIEVALDKSTLTIRGRRVSPMPPDGSRAVAVHLMEIDHGTFCRTVEVPANVEDAAIGANYHVGMLWITLPKRKG
jgi:HSP20 family protein